MRSVFPLLLISCLAFAIGMPQKVLLNEDVLDTLPDVSAGVFYKPEDFHNLRRKYLASRYAYNLLNQNFMRSMALLACRLQQGAADIGSNRDADCNTWNLHYKSKKNFDEIDKFISPN